MASKFEAVSNINPYGETDNVLKLTIDGTSKSYRLSNLITKNDTYTFVIWHKTDSSCNITFNIFGNEYTDYSTTSWKKFVQTVTIETLLNKNIEIKPPINSVTYYYEGYLSRGAIDTSWSPAPEDDIANTQLLKTEIEQTAERINLQVSNLQGDLSKIQLSINGIEQSVQDAEDNISSLQQTSTNLSSKIEDANQNISSINQSINNINTQIQDVNGNYTSLSQSLNGFKQEVVENYPNNEQLNSAIQQAADEITSSVSSIPIGGRNMLLNSNFIMSHESSEEDGDPITSANPNIYPENWTAYDSTVSNPTTAHHAYVDGEKFGFNAIVFDESSGNKTKQSISQTIVDMTYVDKHYTFSFDLYATGNGGKIYGGFYYYQKGTNKLGFNSGQFNITDFSVNEWSRYNVKVPLNNDVDLARDVVFYVYGYNFSSNITLYMTKLKLESGESPTAWTPAPEDTDSMLSSKITQTSEAIQAQVSELNGVVSALELNTSEISTEINNAKGDSSSLSQRIDGISSTVTELGQYSKFLQESDKFVAQITSLENNYIGIQPIINSMTFDENGLTIGVSNSNTFVRINDQGLTIYEGEAAIAWFKDNNMYITTANIGTSIKIGAFTFKPEDNESLSFGKF